MHRKIGILQWLIIPNAFVQTVVDEEDADHCVIVHIQGPLVDILVSIAPDIMYPLTRVARRC